VEIANDGSQVVSSVQFGDSLCLFV
jgi:hypothetical protein